VLSIIRLVPKSTTLDDLELGIFWGLWLILGY